MVEQKWEFDKNSEHYHKQKSGRQHRDSIRLSQHTF